MLLLGIELRSSGKTASALNLWAISPATKIYLVYVYERFVCLSVCRSEEVTWDYSYRWLGATKWVLGTELGTFERAASALNHWTISLDLFFFFVGLKWCRLLKQKYGWRLLLFWGKGARGGEWYVFWGLMDKCLHSVMQSVGACIIVREQVSCSTHLQVEICNVTGSNMDESLTNFPGYGSFRTDH